MESLSGKRVTVMGLGRFGGGLGAARWLASQGADVVVTDLAPADKLAEPLAEIQPLIDRGIVSLRLGEHNISDFTTCDLVVANPAVPKPWENRFLRAASAAGIPISTEIRLLVERLPNRDRTIGVTGTAGKSTTSAMIQHILTRLGRRTHLGGNIGVSLLDELPRITSDDWVVLELSSFMLYWLGEGVGFAGARGWSPVVAVLTNLTPNHLDWHGTFEHYAQSKLQITRSQRGEQDDFVTVRTPEQRDAPNLWHDLPSARLHQLSPTDGRGDPVPVGDVPLSIPGRHNQVNARTAIAAACAALRRDPELSTRPAAQLAADAALALHDFAGLPHRLALVGAVRGVRYFNDSKCTTPEAALLAVQAFADDPGVGAGRVHLIAGGYDKGSAIAPIARLAGELAGLYTMGTTGPAIAAAAGGSAIPCGTLESAVNAASTRAKPGDVVLLSPACASWDQFINYEHRGDAFVRLVGELAKGAT